LDWKQIAEDYPHLEATNPPSLEKTDEVVLLLGNDNGPIMTVDHRVESPFDPFNEPWAEHCRLSYMYTGQISESMMLENRAKFAGLTIQTLSLMNLEGKEEKRTFLYQKEEDQLSTNLRVLPVVQQQNNPIRKTEKFSKSQLKETLVPANQPS